MKYPIGYYPRFFFLIPLSILLITSCNQSQDSDAIQNTPETLTTSDPSSKTSQNVPKGKSQKLDDVNMKITEFKNLGKKIKYFDEEKSAIHDWIRISINVQSLKKQPVRANDLYQFLQLEDKAGNAYTSEIFHEQCEEADGEQIVKPNGNVNFCLVFDAPNKPKEIYLKGYDANFQEVKFLLN